MAVVSGPFLSFRSADATHWRVSALWLLDAADPAPSVTASSVAPIAISPAVALATKNSWQAWRVDLAVTRPASGRALVTYELAGGSSAAFSVPAAGEPLRFAFASCNGFSSPKAMETITGPSNARWESLLDKHAAASLDFIVLGGDQVYGDSIPITLTWLTAWLALDQTARAAHIPTPGEIASLESAYFALYAERWSQVDVRTALASIPSLAMWDDHDIIDGWGSLDDALQSTPVYQALFAAADLAFRVFQLQVAPSSLPAGSIAGAALSHLQRIDDVVIVSPDLRSQRKQDRLLTPAAWQAVYDAIAVAAANKPKHLLVVSGPPVVYPATTALQKLLEVIPGEQSVEDDLRDRWGATPHRPARRKLVGVLFDATKAHGVRATILSGDVHHAALGRIRKKRPGVAANANEILNLVSSAIVHSPPPKLALWALKLLSQSFSIASGVRARMIPLPGLDENYVARRNYLLLKADAQSRLTAEWWFERPDLPAGENKRTLVIEPV